MSTTRELLDRLKDEIDDKKSDFKEKKDKFKYRAKNKGKNLVNKGKDLLGIKRPFEVNFDTRYGAQIVQGTMAALKVNIDGEKILSLGGKKNPILSQREAKVTARAIEIIKQEREIERLSAYMNGKKLPRLSDNAFFSRKNACEVVSTAIGLTVAAAAVFTYLAL